MSPLFLLHHILVCPILDRAKLTLENHPAREVISSRPSSQKPLQQTKTETNHLIDGPEGKCRRETPFLNKADQASNRRSWHPNQRDNVQGSIRNAWSGSEQHGLCTGGRRAGRRETCGWHSGHGMPRLATGSLYSAIAVSRGVIRPRTGKNNGQVCAKETSADLHRSMEVLRSKNGGSTCLKMIFLPVVGRMTLRETAVALYKLPAASRGMPCPEYHPQVSRRPAPPPSRAMSTLFAA